MVIVVVVNVIFFSYCTWSFKDTCKRTAISFQRSMRRKPVRHKKNPPNFSRQFQNHSSSSEDDEENIVELTEKPTKPGSVEPTNVLLQFHTPLLSSGSPPRNPPGDNEDDGVELTEKAKPRTAELNDGDLRTIPSSEEGEEEIVKIVFV